MSEETKTSTSEREQQEFEEMLAALKPGTVVSYPKEVIEKTIENVKWIKERFDELSERSRRQVTQLAAVTAERDEARRERDELRELLLEVYHKCARKVRLDQEDGYVTDPGLDCINRIAAALNTEGKQDAT